MLAEVISIGDELTSGQRLDTNSQWLSERLGELGVRVVYHTTVADELDANVLVLGQAIERADVVVATGGLGPTADDLTRDALAQVTGRELVLDEAVLAHIRGLFARFARDMPERNRLQALFPEGSRIIPNPHGTAPGIDLEVPRPGRRACRIFALPGVPAEMIEMWHQTVAGAIAEWTQSRQVLVHRRIKCFGAGESHVERMLPDLIRRGREPSVGITVSGAVITLRITATGESREACAAAIEPTAATIRQCLGELVYGEEEDELEDAVARELRAQHKTLATAEWGTGGLVCHWLSELPDIGGHYRGGISVTSAAALMAALELSEELCGRNGGASGELAEAMAVACRARMQSDLALAVSNVPPEDPRAAEPGRIFFALASAEGTLVRSVPYFGHPSILKPRAARQALNMARLALLRGLKAAGA